MDLDPYQVGYFITQVGLSAASFGVTTDDVTAVGEALAKLFDYRCAPPTTVVPAQGPQLQSICQDDTCPISANGTCPASPMEPFVANATLAMGEGRNSTGNASTTASTSATPVPTQMKGMGARVAVSTVVMGAAMVAFACL